MQMNNEPSITWLSAQGTRSSGGGSDHHKPERIEWTVREYAKKERVSERTVWTWISKDAVQVRRTPGGRVRILSK